MVHSTKHYVQQSIGTTVPGTNTNTTFAHAVAIVNKNQVFEVEEGCSIKAVYVELWVRSAATAAASFTFVICKRPGSEPHPTDANLAALGDWENKKNVFYCCQALTNDVDSTAIALYKGWVKIPKGKQRMGLGDELSWSLRAVGQSINFCGFVTYKEYQ